MDEKSFPVFLTTFTCVDGAAFGSDKYSAEELVAEMTSARTSKTFYTDDRYEITNPGLVALPLLVVDIFGFPLVLRSWTLGGVSDNYHIERLDLLWE